MHNVSRLAGIFACAATLAAAGCAGGTGVTPATGSPTSATTMSQIQGGSHTLIYMPTVKNAQHVFPQYSNAIYGNGPLLYKPKMYLIFWGFKKAGDPDNVAQLLEQFQSTIGGSTHNEIYVQYRAPRNSSRIRRTKTAVTGWTTPTPFRRRRPTSKSPPNHCSA